jgi:ABC-type glycerol-3-phosphate transport system substrate-binding protein
MYAKQIKRRDFLRAMVIGTAGVVAAACTPSSPTPTSAPAAATEVAKEPTLAPKEPVTISYWHIWGGVRTDQLQQVLDDFMAEIPEIKVEPLLLPNPGYVDKIITGLAGDAPDLTMAYIGDTFAPSARRGALRPLDDLIQADGIDTSIWYKGQWNMTQWEGKSYGLPFVGNFLSMLYWVKDHLEAGGFDPEEGPATWDDLEDMARELTTYFDDGSIENMGYVPGGSGEWIGGAYRNGHEPYGDGSVDSIAIDHPRSLEALERTVRLYEAMGGWDAVGAATEYWGNQQLGNPMISGVASIIGSGVFTVNIINESAPDLDYKIGQVPHGPNGEFLDLTVGGWNNCIPTRAQHPEEAWELAKYLSMGDGHLKFMVELQARPAMIKAYNEAPHDAKARAGNPYWDIVLEILNGKHASYPVTDKQAQWDSVIGEAFESVMLGQRTPEAAVSWAQGEVVRIAEEED